MKENTINVDLRIDFEEAEKLWLQNLRTVKDTVNKDFTRVIKMVAIAIKQSEIKIERDKHLEKAKKKNVSVQKYWRIESMYDNKIKKLDNRFSHIKQSFDSDSGTYVNVSRKSNVLAEFSIMKKVSPFEIYFELSRERFFYEPLRKSVKIIVRHELTRLAFSQEYSSVDINKMIKEMNENGIKKRKPHESD